MIYAKARYGDATVELHYDEAKSKTFLYGNERLSGLIESEDISEAFWPPHKTPSVMLPQDKVFIQVYKLELMEFIEVEWLSAHPALIAPDNVEI